MNEPEGAPAEVVPEVKPETVAEGETPKPEVAAPPEGEKQPEKPKKGLTKRFSELTRKIRDYERENIALKQQVATQVVTKEAEPKAEQFSDYDAYLKAVARQSAVAAAQEIIGKRDQEQSQAKADAERRKVEASFDDREEAVREELEDYDEVTRNEHLTISPPMAEAIKTSEVGPKIAYHLGKNPELAFKIANMSPIAAAVALGRIEAQLTLAPTPQVTAAKPPPKTVGASAPADVPEDKLTAAEWIARRNKEVHRRSA